MNVSGLATQRQIGLLHALSHQRVMSPEVFQRLTNMLDGHRSGVMPLTFEKADASIKWCLQLPRIEFTQQEPVAVGVYRINETIYIVKPNRDGTRRYAVRLVVSPPRLTENGEEVNFSYEQARGVVYQLTPADRMSVDDLRDFMIKYRKCVKCGKSLKRPETLLRAEEIGVMVGKTCATKMGLI